MVLLSGPSSGGSIKILGHTGLRRHSRMSVGIFMWICHGFKSSDGWENSFLSPLDSLSVSLVNSWYCSFMRSFLIEDSMDFILLLYRAEAVLRCFYVWLKVVV